MSKDTRRYRVAAPLGEGGLPGFSARFPHLAPWKVPKSFLTSMGQDASKQKLSKVRQGEGAGGRKATSWESLAKSMMRATLFRHPLARIFHYSIIYCPALLVSNPIYLSVDMSTIRKRLHADKYHSVSEFHADMMRMISEVQKAAVDSANEGLVQIVNMFHLYYMQQCIVYGLRVD